MGLFASYSAANEWCASRGTVPASRPKLARITLALTLIQRPPAWDLDDCFLRRYFSVLKLRLPAPQSTSAAGPPAGFVPRRYYSHLSLTEVPNALRTLSN